MDSPTPPQTLRKTRKKKQTTLSTDSATIHRPSIKIQKPKRYESYSNNSTAHPESSPDTFNYINTSGT